MSKIIVTNLTDLEEKFLQAVHIMKQMRRFKKKWEVEYGTHNRKNLRRWEENADAFLSSLNIREDDTSTNSDPSPNNQA